MPEFIADLDAGEVSGVYYELIDQPLSRTDYGLSRWQLTTIIRAIVANGRTAHAATLTFPHGPTITLMRGHTVEPTGDDAGRWQEAHAQPG
jgi:hypothetical protein